MSSTTTRSAAMPAFRQVRPKKQPTSRREFRRKLRAMQDAASASCAPSALGTAARDESDTDAAAAPPATQQDMPRKQQQQQQQQTVSPPPRKPVALSANDAALVAVRGAAIVRAMVPHERDEATRVLATLCSQLYGDAIVGVVCRACYGPLARLRLLVGDGNSDGGDGDPCSKRFFVHYDTRTDIVHMRVPASPTARDDRYYDAAAMNAYDDGDATDAKNDYVLQRALWLAAACPLPPRTSRDAHRAHVAALVRRTRRALAADDALAQRLIAWALDMRVL